MVARAEVPRHLARKPYDIHRRLWTLSFLLAANPVKTIVDAEQASKQGKTSTKGRVPLIHEGEQIAWLARKIGDAAEMQTPVVQVHTPVHFRKGGRPGKVVTVTSTGLLRVDNPKSLLLHLQNGIRRARAFGCGLLLVRRVG